MHYEPARICALTDELIAMRILSQKLAKQREVPFANVQMRVGHLAVDTVIVDYLVTLLPFGSPFSEASLASEDISDDRHPLFQVLVSYSWFMLAIDTFGHLPE